jgi:hypothetical protein
MILGERIVSTSFEKVPRSDQTTERKCETENKKKVCNGYSTALAYESYLRSKRKKIEDISNWRLII